MKVTHIRSPRHVHTPRLLQRAVLGALAVGALFTVSGTVRDVAQDGVTTLAEVVAAQVREPAPLPSALVAQAQLAAEVDAHWAAVAADVAVREAHEQLVSDVNDVWAREAEKRRAAEAERARIARGELWDRLAWCESTGRWDYNGSSGFDGGLQFHPGTWSAYAPAGYPAYAWQATREQQIAVAERVLDAQGWGAWPACSRKLGLR